MTFIGPDPNWPRWIVGSFREYITVNGIDVWNASPDGQQYPIVLLTDGIDERTTTFMESPNRAELRINGPRPRPTSPRGCYKLEADVNVLYTFCQDQLSDAWIPHKFGGLQSMHSRNPYWDRPSNR